MFQTFFSNLTKLTSFKVLFFLILFLTYSKYVKYNNVWKIRLYYVYKVYKQLTKKETQILLNNYVLQVEFNIRFHGLIWPKGEIVDVK